jgi:hypothetical protein
MSLEREFENFLKTKNVENLNNVYNRILTLNTESKLSFGKKLRNQLISVIDDEKDRPVELRFVMCMCKMLGSETLFLAHKNNMYEVFLDILICMETPDFRHVVLAFGFKFDFLKMENVIKTKYSKIYSENQIFGATAPAGGLASKIDNVYRTFVHI